MQYSKNAEIYKNIITPYLGGPISFSGLPAVGKSTITGILAEELSLPRFELDDEISIKAGLSTTKEVINKYGHAFFKELQHLCLKEILENTSGNYLIATGGEVWRPGNKISLVEKNRELIKSKSYNVCLMPSDNIDEIVEVLYPRQDDGKRNTRTTNKESFKDYANYAINQYIELADMVIFTHSSPVSNTLSLIKRELLGIYPITQKQFQYSWLSNSATF